MNSQKLSVVIPAYNEERVIANSINSLLRQSYKNFEIIIVDDGSTDKTREIVREISKKNKKVMLLTQNHEGPGNARNLGAKKSTGRILIFVDADMEFEKEFLEKISVDIRKGHVIGTKYGYEEAKNYEQNVWSRCFGKVRWNAYGFGVKEYPVFSAILKSEFDKVNGFDPSMGYADDQSL
ncbi:MAG: glycosyltransferase, partial [Nanoarchaeota archaeon]|nr:glycosyltransferase [Nanoarchaeota archaeon]